MMESKSALASDDAVSVGVPARVSLSTRGGTVKHVIQQWRRGSMTDVHCDSCDFQSTVPASYVPQAYAEHWKVWREGWTHDLIHGMDSAGYTLEDLELLSSEQLKARLTQLDGRF